MTVRVIPVSSLRAENMRRVRQPKAQLITTFSHNKLQASLLRQNHVLIPKSASMRLTDTTKNGKFLRHKNSMLKVVNLTDIIDCYEMNKRRQ